MALKFLPADTTTHDALTVDRFKREARTASALNHPNICTIYDIDEHEGAQFIAMELLDGQSLEDRLRDGPLSAPETISIGLGILTALGALHGRGIVHRDLKPSNVFLTTHGVKLLDFGLARPVADEALTMAAEAYYRLTNRLAPVNVTSGPGGTNAIPAFGARSSTRSACW